MANTEQVIDGDLVLSMDAVGVSRDVPARQLVYGWQSTGTITATLEAFVGNAWATLIAVSGDQLPAIRDFHKDTRVRANVTAVTGGSATIILSPDTKIS